MKKLPFLITTALIGLSSNLFAQTGITSYSENNDDRQGNLNVFIGYLSGYANTSEGKSNVFTGHQSGRFNTTGASNVFSGASAGYKNTKGNHNVFTGTLSGYNNETGSFNTFSGRSSGYNNETGTYNTFLGFNAGHKNTIGNNNVFIGRDAGSRNTTGNNNVFIGKNAGYYETGSDKLNIDNNITRAPLIYGDFSANELTFNGKVSTGVGNTSFPTSIDGINISNYTLFVQGGLLSEEVRVRTDWADYVFNDTYKLKSLNEVESFIKDNGHLPNVPSAKEVEASGIEMGEITKIQQEKIEELTLYLIAMDKRVKLIEQENIRLQKELVELNESESK